MNNIILILFFMVCCSRLTAQPLPDSIRIAFNKQHNETEKGRVLVSYFDMNVDNVTVLTELVALKKYFDQMNQPAMSDYVNVVLCRQLSRKAEYAASINELFSLLPRFEKRNDAYGVMVCNRHLSYAYYAAADSSKTLYYDRKTVYESEVLGQQYDITIAYNNIGADMAEYHHFDSAYYYARSALDMAQDINLPLLISKTLSTMGEGFIAMKEYDSAMFYIRKSLKLSVTYSKLDYAYGLNDLAQVYSETQQHDSAVFYGTAAAEVAANIHLMNQLLRAYQYMYKGYGKTGPADSAYKYLQLMVAVKDSIYSTEEAKSVQLITIREQNRIEEIGRQKVEFNNKLKIYGLLAGLIVFSFIGFLLYRNTQKEKKAKLLLQKKNDTIEKTLTELKLAQSQLIQSEKMASLGELTAGIAHEIQNPLNFVNNFSEINKELVDEATEEIGKGNYDDAKDILKDVKDNSEKINHHGKRADTIVKGMLQHSRSSGGQKEPTDINVLCDEYLRLSYHGLRAKDKNFNATLETDFDTSIGKINLIPQDIGRVIMNLLTNAFYAVNEKKKLNLENFEPRVSIKTSLTTHSGNGVVSISVSDNGNGIPQNIIDKIFQPFFTTKPTGQGTGLGLSLSYDIIKAHGGKIKIESQEKESTEFLIVLPL